jgi:integrase
MATMARRAPQGFYKRGRTWHVRTDPVTGKARSSGCTDLDAAIRWYREQQRKAVDPAYAAEKDPGINSWAMKLLEIKKRQRSPATVHYYTKKLGHIVRFFGAESPVSSMMPARFDDYVAQRLEEGAKPHTISKEIKAARLVAKLAARSGAFRGDPATFQPVDFSPQYEPRERFLTPAELVRLLDVLSPKRAAHVALSVAIGPRYSEAFRVERRDIDLDSWTVFVRGTKTPKSKATIPVATPFRGLLLSALPFLPLEPWGNMRRDLAAACKRAGIEKVTSNDLRRTHGTWLAEAGVGIDLVSKVLRHSSPQVTAAVYAKPRAELVGKAIEAQISVTQSLQSAPEKDPKDENPNDVQVAQSVEQWTEKPVVRVSQAAEIAREGENPAASGVTDSAPSDADVRWVRNRIVTSARTRVFRAMSWRWFRRRALAGAAGVTRA